MTIFEAITSVIAATVYICIGLSFLPKFEKVRKKMIAVNFLLIAINCFLLILDFIIYK